MATVSDEDIAIIREVFARDLKTANDRILELELTQQSFIRLLIERDERIANLEASLESIDDSGYGGCHAEYGPGCDGNCKRTAFKALKNSREILK